MIQQFAKRCSKLLRFIPYKLNLPRSRIVDYVVTFPQLPMHAYIVAGFVMKLFPKLLFHQLDIITVIRRILDEEFNVGFYTAVQLYSSDLGLSFVWCHKTNRPLGHDIGVQCPSCGRLRSYDVNTDMSNLVVIVTCRACARVSVIRTSTSRQMDLQVQHTGEGWAVDVLWGRVP